MFSFNDLWLKLEGGAGGGGVNVSVYGLTVSHFPCKYCCQRGLTVCAADDYACNPGKTKCFYWLVVTWLPKGDKNSCNLTYNLPFAWYHEVTWFLLKLNLHYCSP